MRSMVSAVGIPRLQAGEDVKPSLYSVAGDLKCHCFVRDGRIEYLSDSTHEFRGKSVDMPAWPFSGEIA